MWWPVGRAFPDLLGQLLSYSSAWISINGVGNSTRSNLPPRHFLLSLIYFDIIHQLLEWFRSSAQGGESVSLPLSAQQDQISRDHYEKGGGSSLFNGGYSSEDGDTVVDHGPTPLDRVINRIKGFFGR